MNLLELKTAMRASLLLVSAILAMQLAGCSPEEVAGGGLEGTGTGPTTNSYQLRNLPERISPDIPETHIRGEELAPSQPENTEPDEQKRAISFRMDDAGLERSANWAVMNGELIDDSLLRVNSQINSTIIDIAFNEIRTRCVDQLVDCTISGDQIKVKLTQEVINRFIELATGLVESLPPDFWPDYAIVDAIAVIKEQFTSLLDSEVVLGETYYSQLDGAPYDHSVRTFLSREPVSDRVFASLLWLDEAFSARWDNDRDVAKFVLEAADTSTREYFYQDNVPSEIVVASYMYPDGTRQFDDYYVKLIANDPDRAGVLIEFARVRTVSEPVAGNPTLRLDRGLFQGRIDNSGGYVQLDGVSFDVFDTPETVGFTGVRESFDRVGNLLAGTRCTLREFTVGNEVCNEADYVSTGPVGSSITDSPYYFPSGTLDSLVAVHDAIRWTVEGVPLEIKGVAVVSADSAVELSERELLCRGFPFVSGDTRMFCSATDEQLANTIVLELVDGKAGDIIPGATLVQIQ